MASHQPHGCSLNHSFRCRSKKTSKFRVTGLCAGDSPVTSEFPAQMASNAENISIWWRHHGDVSLWFGTRDPFYQQGLTLIPACISNRIPSLVLVWNYLSIPKLHRLHCWSLEMYKWFHLTLYNGFNYSSTLRLKLNHASKRGSSRFVHSLLDVYIAT